MYYTRMSEPKELPIEIKEKINYNGVNYINKSQ